MILRAATLVAATLLLQACVTPRVVGPGGFAPTLESTPFFPQQDLQCGPAALAAVLVPTGIATTPEALVPRVYLPSRRGSLQVEMLSATRQLGRVPYRVAPTLDSLVAELRAGHAVLVLQNLLLRSLPRWHYAVVIGVDARGVLLRSGTQRERRMSHKAFMRSWGLADHWGFVALRPGELPGDADAQRWLKSHAALEQAGRGVEAAAGYQAATRHWPEDARFWLGLGNVRYIGRDLPAATAAFRRATELQPMFAPAWNNLAQVLAEQQCRGAALRALERGLAVADVALLPALETTRRELPDNDGAACPENAR